MNKTRSKKIKYRKTISNTTRKNKSLKRVFSKKDYNSGDGMLTSVWRSEEHTSELQSH